MLMILFSKARKRTPISTIMKPMTINLLRVGEVEINARNSNSLSKEISPKNKTADVNRFINIF